MSQEQPRREGETGAPDDDVFARLISPADPGEFFAKTWQQEPRLFPAADAAGLRPLLPLTWSDCLDVLLLGWGASPSGPPPDGTDLLTFKGKQLTHEYDDSGPCAALLNGASCVVNHAEHIYEPFLRLTTQLRRKLLHVYANTYITPPGSQAVPAHADDRDVFILQLCGSKRWKVYGTPPIKLPYTEEQVGKNSLPVPEEILTRTPLIECILQPGDVLYMPRGFVHEADTNDMNASAWHATLAVATHDWSWTKVYASTLVAALDKEVSAQWRAAVPLELGRPLPAGAAADEDGTEAAAEKELATLAAFAQQAVTGTSLRRQFLAKLSMHNRNQDNAAAAFQQDPGKRHPGGDAHWLARHVGPTTCLRKSTPAEKEADKAAPTPARRGSRRGKGGGKGGSSGLMVREEIGNAVILTLGEMEKRKEAGVAVSDFSSEGAELFDDLSKLCLARVCVASGAFKLVGEAAVPSAADGPKGDLAPEPQVSR